MIIQGFDIVASRRGELTNQVILPPTAIKRISKFTIEDLQRFSDADLREVIRVSIDNNWWIINTFSPNGSDDTFYIDEATAQEIGDRLWSVRT